MLFCIPIHFLERGWYEPAALARMRAPDKLAQELNQVAMLGVKFRNANA